MIGYGLRWGLADRSSTGNDIVSLSATQPERTCRPRFYSRILTIAEQELYQRLDHEAMPFDAFIWLCWSVKESAYKYSRRLFPGLVFSPLNVGIRQIAPASHPSGGFYRCRVICAEAELYSRTLIRDGVIETIVSRDEAFADTRWGSQSIGSSTYADQSSAVRTLVLRELKTALSRDDLRMEKDPAGCPIVLAGERRLEIPVSLAHHDRYVAYSFCYSPAPENNSL
jgi:hypothetical protein